MDHGGRHREASPRAVAVLWEPLRAPRAPSEQTKRVSNLAIYYSRLHSLSPALPLPPSALVGSASFVALLSCLAVVLLFLRSPSSPSRWRSRPSSPFSLSAPASRLSRDAFPPSCPDILQVVESLLLRTPSRPSLSPSPPPPAPTPLPPPLPLPLSRCPPCN